MNAILLCPGPSLARFRMPEARPDLVVGVNRAATVQLVDAWVCGDIPLIDRICGEVRALHESNGMPLPPLITSVDGHAGFDARVRMKIHRPWESGVICWTELLGWCPRLSFQPIMSASSALIYCGWRGASEIDVYGADWSGTADFDGVQAGQNRTPARWEAEAQIWTNLLIPWLTEKKIAVRRHVPELSDAIS